MNEERFWSMIEAAWEVAGGYAEQRHLLASVSDDRDEIASELQDVVGDVVGVLEEALDELSAEELMEFDRILERKLYQIDREELQHYTDGSDDGFLYARGFIVAMGKEYYDAVDADPSMAMLDMECEDLCYVSWHIYEAKYGPMPDSEISRESCSNASKW